MEGRESPPGLASGFEDGLGILFGVLSSLGLAPAGSALGAFVAGGAGAFVAGGAGAFVAGGAGAFVAGGVGAFVAGGAGASVGGGAIVGAILAGPLVCFAG